MSDDSDDKKSKNISSSDLELWQDMTEDVKPLSGNVYEESAPAKKLAIRYEPKQSPISTPIPLQEKITEQSHGAGLDRRSEEKLRRGQMKIEARLDLHGMSQIQAFEALQAFILSTYGQGKRCVLVITGKGSRSRGGSESAVDSWLDSEKGILKRKTPQWLKEYPMAPLILKTVAARPKDGGDGALYVLLRRQR